MSQYARSMKMPASTLSRRQRALSIALAAGLAAGVQAAGPDSHIRAFHDSTVPQSPHQVAIPKTALMPNNNPVRSGLMVVHVKSSEGFNRDLGMIRSSHPDLTLVRSLDPNSGVYLLDAGSPEAALGVQNDLRSLPSVVFVQLDQVRPNPYQDRSIQVSPRLRGVQNGGIQAPGIEISPQPVRTDTSSPRGIAVDPLFGSQWHFINNVNAQRDNNIPASVYTSQGLSGAGTVVGLTNAGFNTHLDIDHTELDANYSLDLSTPFDPNLFPDSQAITSLAGIVSGEINGAGIQGVAPGSTVATINWPGFSGTIPFQEFVAYNWKLRDFDIKVFNGSGFYDFPNQAYNPGALDSFVLTPLRNSFAFARGGRGAVNIFSTGTVSVPVSFWPDPYNFPPANPGDSWSPLDEVFNSGNEVSITLTNGWTNGPFYAGAQVTHYAPANDRRSFVFNTVAEDGFIDVLAGQGSNVFASFYGGTTNQFLSGSQAVSGLGVLTAVPGGGNVGFIPSSTAPGPSGNETMTGAMIGAGLISMMLEINPSLSIRDIQHILFQSIQESTKPANIKWPNFDINRTYMSFGGPPFPLVTSFWQVNTGLYSGGTVENQAIRHSDLYGFGVVDAELALQKAANWQGVPKLLLLDTGFVGSFDDPAIDSEDEIEIEIPDATFLEISDPDGAAGIDGAAAVLPGPFVPLPQFCVRQNVRIESVAIELTVTGAGASDLYVMLQSPNGTTSNLKLPAPQNLIGTSDPDVFNDDDFDAAGDVIINDTNYALYRHTFLTYKHWGELSGGQWSVSIADFGPDEENPEGEEPTDDGMGGGDPGADMVISLGAFGLPGSEFREEKTVTGYRFMIYGTEIGEPNFDGCPPTQTSCPGDLDGNGIVDIFDFFIYIQWYNENNALADIDEDGDVDFSDLLAFRALWIPGFCDGDPNFGGRPRPGDSNAGDDNNPGSRPI